MSTRIDRRRWNTYAMTGYAHDVANDPQSQGGVHFHQVRHAGDGGWQYRIVQSNGHFFATGPVQPLADADGAARFARAEVYA